MQSVVYDLVTAEQLEDAILIERSVFPEDEAASLETFKYRQASAPHLFLGAYAANEDNKLIGYICSTSSDSETLTHASMTNHLPEGKSVCIHAVCVHPDYQRKGIGLGMLQEYLRRFEQATEEKKYERVLLLSHEDMIPFYTKAGFDLVGKSDVVHGSKTWFQLRYLLPPPPPDPAMQLRIFQAMKEQQEQPRRQGPSKPFKQPLIGFSGGVAQVTNANSTNKVDLLCPRPGCTSVILKSDIAKLTERPSVKLDNPAKLPPPELLPHLPSSIVPIWTWKIGPPANPMVFENIGFSRNLPAQPSSTNPAILKLLTCAECDLGPLGWCEEGGEGMVYWLACNRIGYRI